MTKSVLHDRTPTLHSQALSKLSQRAIYLKMECNQPSHSFKIRGIGRLCQHYAKQGATRFISSSGGNAGISTAYAGRLLNIAVEVFVPETSHALYLQAIKNEGATVHVHGASWQEANEAAMQRTTELDATYIPPFDHPILWSGHASIIDEVVADNIKSDAVVVAVGGGGLACGLLEGMHKHDWQHIPVYAIETEGAAAFYASVQQHQQVHLDSINTIATSLGTKYVTKALLEWTQSHRIIPIKVSDEACVRTIARFADDHRILIEPSCASALSVVYDQHPLLKQHHSLLVIVCGGHGISLSLLAQWQQQFETKKPQ